MTWQKIRALIWALCLVPLKLLIGVMGLVAIGLALVFVYELFQKVSILSYIFWGFLIVLLTFPIVFLVYEEYKEILNRRN